MSDKMREALETIANWYSPSHADAYEMSRLARAALADQTGRGEAVAFLADGMRFKLAPGTNWAKYLYFPKDLGGKWVALVDATDERHLRLTTPTAPVVPDGWKLVPVELTDAMRSVVTRRGRTAMWIAMLAASPEVKP